MGAMVVLSMLGLLLLVLRWMCGRCIGFSRKMMALFGVVGSICGVFIVHGHVWVV